ncbi:endonuclease/exonuclease/phosphatase family protein [Nitratireductor basaltis]|uniref:Endonuclease/exonuclease/phosphatase n=1 Tax=Nitratireductor basaltis TaxID=472175 RepID=A0A084UCD2_9HYPH|nr:endonuclease/exonuclease/phosphatase family protein [Nitratireductor basaltis]KFB10618.1 Endonuclease/exonuclease/phosphatase [Nitratireductor basaltis]
MAFGALRAEHLRWLGIACGIAAVLATGPLVMGFWGALHPAFDALSHFRIHLAVLIALLAVPAIFIRGWRMIGLMAVALAVASVTATLNMLNPASQAQAAANGQDGARYRLLQMNLRFDNATPKSVLSLIGRSNADIVTLNEVSTKWQEELGFIKGAYPYQVICQARARVGGVAILSRRPFMHPATAACHERGSLATASVMLGDRVVNVAALHLGWPWPFGQHAQVERARPTLEKLGKTTILAGDFNAAPWSETVRRVLEAGAFSLPQAVGPTWLARPLPDALRRTVGLPIDHVLIKGGLEVHSIARQGDAGSDHLPVLVEFSLLPQERAGEAVLAETRRHSHFN